MMSILIKELVKQRRSVRTFDGRALTDEDRKYMTDLLSSLENPWGISIEFFLLNAKQNGLTSPVIIGAEEYIAANKKQKYFFIFVHEDGEGLERINNIFAEKHLVASVDEVFSLDDVNKALKKVASGKSKGKTVLRINE